MEDNLGPLDRAGNFNREFPLPTGSLVLPFVCDRAFIYGFVLALSKAASVSSTTGVERGDGIVARGERDLETREEKYCQLLDKNVK